MPSPPRILFVLKQRLVSSDAEPAACPSTYSSTFSSGIYNSVRFVSDMLTDAGVENRVIEAVDNNYIDCEVAEYRPTHVVIEALWVVPEKIDILAQLYPEVKWIIRLHSDLPFLSNEGIAIDWIVRCAAIENVTVAANSLLAQHDLRKVIYSAYPYLSEDALEAKIAYLPNFYPIHNMKMRDPLFHSDELNIGCFGAIRPLKNNLIQAVAAIEYADRHGLRLRFHINGSRNEQGGDNNLKNLTALFHTSRHELVSHPWMPHEEFLRVLARMSLSMCVSFTETFCIVAADSVALGVPTLVSKAINWASPLCTAATTDTESITRGIDRVLHPILGRLGAYHNRCRLRNQCDTAREVWLRYFKRHDRDV